MTFVEPHLAPNKHAHHVMHVVDVQPDQLKARARLIESEEAVNWLLVRNMRDVYYTIREALIPGMLHAYI